MPSIEGDEGRPSSPVPLTHLPFPRLSRSHILHCSYHFWHPIYRSITPKARLITLTPAFLSYLREDGIVLPPDDDAEPSWTDEDSGVFSDASDSDDDALIDPSENFREVHLKVKEVIEELDGHVAPKLNWSAPKDATWIATTNSMECRTPSDIYLLLKSSDFVTHDLEHAFDDCEPPETPEESQDIPFTLVLRKYINLNPSVEFRCFVRDRELIAICQRDLNHFDFLFPMVDELRSRIQKFFDEKLKDTFPDANFAFDVYIPPPHKRVWLIDINPWAQRTDPLLFSWLELLSMQTTTPSVDAQETSFGISGGQDEEVEELPFTPVFRLVKMDDPEAYSFNTPQYSAHKMPKDVVDASAGPGPLREFAEQWKDIMRRQEQEDADDD